jgi:hypothetical protein
MEAIMQGYALAALGLTFAGVLALMPVTVVSFLGVVWLYEQIEEVPSEGIRDALTAAMVPVVLAFLVLDVLFNATWGTFYFREWPQWQKRDGKREWLFTDRVERHYRTCAYEGPPTAPTHVYAYTGQQREAVRWAEFLNNVDPQHVTMHKG